MKVSTKGPFYSHWCALLDFHLKRKRMPGSRFALLVGSTQQAVHSYHTGKSRPPLDLVRDWSDKLGLSHHERDQFVTAAYEAWTPGPIWAKLVELENAVSQATQRSDTSVNQTIIKLQGAVDSLLGVLREVEALFFARTVPMQDIHARRGKLALAIRSELERTARPPVRSSSPANA